MKHLWFQYCQGAQDLLQCYFSLLWHTCYNNPEIAKYFFIQNLAFMYILTPLCTCVWLKEEIGDLWRNSTRPHFQIQGRELKWQTSKTSATSSVTFFYTFDLCREKLSHISSFPIFTNRLETYAHFLSHRNLSPSLKYFFVLTIYFNSYSTGFAGVGPSTIWQTAPDFSASKSKLRQASFM